jgi:maleylpyruvate isomerase
MTDAPSTAAVDSLQSSLDLMMAGTKLLLATVEGIGDEQIYYPSALPGWNRAAVITHLARNADALTNLLTWARSGVPNPMYPDPSRRRADIDAGALRDAVELRADLSTSIDTLSAGLAALDPSRWSFLIHTAQGRELPVSVVPWLRSREVWIHSVDLDAAATFDHVSPAFVDALLIDSLAAFINRAECPPILVKPLDRGVETRIGGDGEPAVVTGSARDLLPWVLGRSDEGPSRLTSSTGALPELPPWL